ncbi:nucleolar protein 14 [Crucibulum laeve]|uniref:Nucleolar protein 14 n=1 Tax=Crucibulum laeve TaxID=68775 RepID=A0A5C3MEV5_9AGAR|nr:nucleolar protein 14 [Crucibulum laeve]
MKGSQLTQLKAALSQAGVTGNQNGKKRKRTAPLEKEKEKRAAKLEEIHRRLNPFDVKVTKLKHDVGGRKLKGVTGKPAKAKQAGIEQRRKTLLKEFEEKDRAGGIIDRRFGENDPTMSLEERMLERFTKERQRAAKGSAFNLEDEDELTHYGQSLSKLDDFDGVGLGLESDEDENSGQIGGKAHFGGFGDEDEDEDENGEPARKKSKAEVMAEVIAKSKEHKILRQMAREKDDNLRHELDNEFASLRDLLYLPDPSSTGTNSIPLGRVRSDGPASSTAEEPAVYDPVLMALAPETQDEDYERHVRELAFDKRSKPKDRTKTEEEVALAEKEALEKAEKQRRKRMLGLEDSDEEEGEKMGKRKRGADDLEDDFDFEEGAEESGLGAGLGDGGKGGIGEEDEENDDDDEGSEEEGNEDEDGSEEEASEFEDESDESEAEEGEHEDLIAPAKPAKGKSKAKSKELPFTFPCPSSHEEFLEIVEDVEDKDVPIVVQRIRALYHTSLGPDNKFKLQTLATVLIDHILYVTSPPTPHFTLLTSLLPHLIALTRAYPIPAARYFNEKLILMHKNLKRGLSRGALDPEAKTWPGLPELSLLRVIGLIWPTSDMNHAVISPTRVLIGAYLGLSRVRSLADIASGLFLCTLFLQFENLSKRLVPEAVNFLVNAVLHLAPHKYKDAEALPGSFPAPDFRSELCKPLVLKVNAKDPPVVQKANLSVLLLDEEPSDQAKADLLGLTLEVLVRFADMYKGVEGFIELYQPILDLLQNIEEKKLIAGHKTLLAKTIDQLQRLLKFSRQARQPLRLQAHKPIPIATYIPKFETTTSNYLRRQDPDHERNEASKLRNQYKQEKKGAIRELRKDARFLAGVEQQKQKQKDHAYNERMKRVFGSIEGERAEEKAMEREKAKEKRRSGRK